MAKRRAKKKSWAEELLAYRSWLLKMVGGIVFIICLLFGYQHGYPLVVEGQVTQGILTGLAYGGGAFAAIMVALYLNRKLKGL